MPIMQNTPEEIRRYIRNHRQANEEREEIAKTCCFTGPRPKNFPWGGDREREAQVVAWLEEQIREAIARGYRHFISGMAAGVDLIAASVVVRLRGEMPEKGIALEAAVPFPEQPSRWKQKTQAEYFRLLALCDRVSMFSERFSVAAYRERDRYMVGASSLVIGVESVPDGGTARTLSYAKAQGRRIVLLGKDEVRSSTARRRRRRTSAAEVGDPFRGVG